MPTAPTAREEQKMNQKTALEIAIECLRKEIQRIAVDANLHENYQADYPAARRSAETRKRLRAAEAALQELLQLFKIERR